MSARWARGLAAPLVGLAVVTLVFSIAAPSFLGAGNAQALAAQTVVVALGAIGMTFVIVSGGIDLSVGSVMALSSVTAAVVLRQGHGDAAAVLAAVAVGVGAGLANGGLVARLGIAPFIATLGTMSAARGAAKWMAGERNVYPPEGWQSSFMAKQPDPSWLLVAPGVWLTLGLALLAGVVLRRTVLGTWVVAVGSNEATAILCGVPVRRVKASVYVIAGALAGVAGVAQLHRLSSGDPTTALGKELEVVAAVVIGGASLAGSEGRMLGSLLGALLMAALANGCNLVDLVAAARRVGLSEEQGARLESLLGGSGIPNYVQEVLVGAIIVAAATADRLRHRRHH